jgi:hypothetical protein
MGHGDPTTTGHYADACGTVADPPSPVNISSRTEQKVPTILWAVAGTAAALLAFAGVHLMHPPGAPEHFTDAQVIAWVRASSAQIWAGGSFSMAAAMLLLVFAQGWATQLDDWGAPTWAAHLARQSITLAATVIALAGILQISCAASAVPSERITEPSLTATLFNLYGTVSVSAWALLLPAVVGGFFTHKPRPRWVPIVTTIAALALAPAIAVPPLAWGTGPAWIILTSAGSAAWRRTQHQDNYDARSLTPA